MQFKEYQREARTTAVYPINYQLQYVVIGLAGETGELLEKLLPYVSNALDNAQAPTEELLSREFGDILWYVANTAHDANIDIDFDLSSSIPFNDVKGSWVEKVFLIVIRMGKISEKVKKALRDNSGILQEVKRQEMKEDLILLLTHLGELASIFGLRLDHIAAQNLEKLFSRKQRGVIGGSGDNR